MPFPSKAPPGALPYETLEELAEGDTIYFVVTNQRQPSVSRRVLWGRVTHVNDEQVHLNPDGVITKRLWAGELGFVFDNYFHALAYWLKVKVPDGLDNVA